MWQNPRASSPPPFSFHLYQSKLYHAFPLLNQASAAFLPWTCSSMSPHSKPWGGDSSSSPNDQHDDRTAHNKTSRDPDRSKHPKSISSQRTPKKREMTSFLWLSFISLCWLSFIFIGPEMPKILLAKKQKCKGWKLEEAKVHPGGRWQRWLQATSYPLSESQNLHPLIFALRCKFKNMWALMYIRPFRWQGHREGFSSEAS